MLKNERETVFRQGKYHPIYISHPYLAYLVVWKAHITEDAGTLTGKRPPKDAYPHSLNSGILLVKGQLFDMSK